MTTKLLNPKDLQARFEVSAQTVTNWVREGLPIAPEAPRDPISGKVLRLYFREEDLEAWIADRKRQGRWRVRGAGRG
jgi:phage terminase Nu1 subunit (DNA packaging protein)